MRSFIERLIHLKKPGIFISIALFPITLCSYLFKALVVLRGFLFRKGIFKSHRLSCKVISIGNITVGGTGKTPATCLIARYLKNAGSKVAVLSRGYRAQGSTELLIVSDGNHIIAGPEVAGDEAAMLAQKLSGVPILAGKNRFLLGQRAIHDFSAQVILLDDGFQHYPLQRDLDIVLINARNPFGNGFLLPRGTLREPISSLSRVPLIVLTKVEETTEVEKLKEVIKRHSPYAHIFTATIGATALKRFLDDTIIPLETVRGRQAVGLCSIGDPESFFALLEDLGFTIFEKLAFPDHHWYGSDDYIVINSFGQGADFIITTEKDIVKLDNTMIDNKKIFILETELRIDREDEFFQTLSTLAGLLTSS
jgi:tetraacyldisaccharide 4'-kinase